MLGLREGDDRTLVCRRPGLAVHSWGGEPHFFNNRPVAMVAPTWRVPSAIEPACPYRLSLSGGWASQSCTLVVRLAFPRQEAEMKKKEAIIG